MRFKEFQRSHHIFSIILLLVGLTHALVMLLMRLFFASGFEEGYLKAVAGHSHFLIGGWVFMVTVELLAHQFSKRDQWWKLLIFISFIILWISIFSEKTFIKLKYSLAGQGDLYWISFGLVNILIGSFAIDKIGTLILEFAKSRTIEWPRIFLVLCLFAAIFVQVLQFRIFIIDFPSSELLLSVANQFFIGFMHLPIQIMTLITVILWFQWLNIALIRFDYIFFLSYPIFNFLVLFSESYLLQWNTNLIYLPAVSTGYFAIRILISWFANRVYTPELMTFFLFNLWGGFTGLLLSLNLLVRTEWSETLSMPGHFHPLVAGGFTAMVILQWTRGAEKTIVARWTMVAGIFLLSSGLMLAGLLGAKRHSPYLGIGAGLNWLIFAGGIMAICSILVLIIALLKAKRARQGF